MKTLKPKIEVTDWVQAVQRICDEDGDVVAERFGVGHVVSIPGDDPHAFDVYWERTGVICTVDLSEIRQIATSATGKTG